MMSCCLRVSVRLTTGVVFLFQCDGYCPGALGPQRVVGLLQRLSSQAGRFRTCAKYQNRPGEKLRDACDKEPVIDFTNAHQRKMDELFERSGGEKAGRKTVHFHLELIQELHDAHISMFQSKEKIKRNIDRLARALESIDEQKETLKVTLDYYRQYLNNARADVLASAPASRQQSSRRFWGRKRQDNQVRFTYKQLVDMKVIVRSD